MRTLTLFISLVITVAHAEVSPSLSKLILKKYPKVDRNGDGAVNAAEFKALEKRLIQKFPKADMDQDGSLSLKEQERFAQLAQKHPSGDKTTEHATTPTHADVSYGDHERQVMDVWLVESDAPTPFAMYIHGGGFKGGSKERLKDTRLKALLEAGISVISINYRYCTTHPLPIPHQDAAYALQLVRSKAQEWNLDKERAGVFGSSAGAQIAMWIGFSDEMADPDNTNPVKRESTRVACVYTAGGQTSTETETWKMLAERFGAPLQELDRSAEFGDRSKEEIDQIAAEISAVNLISADDPPIYMTYGMDPSKKAPELSSPKFKGFLLHHVTFGQLLQEQAEKVSAESYLSHPGAETPYEDEIAFLVSHLKEK